MSEYIIEEVPLSERIVFHDGKEVRTRFVTKEEIVRCRDCTSYYVSEKQASKCRTPCGDSLHGSAYCDPDGFCAWGVRRDG